MNADLLLINGCIYTMDPQRPRATALAVVGEYVRAVGEDDLRALAGPETEVVDLEGRTVLPGLTDSHIHLSWFALSLQQVDLTGTASREEMLARVAARVAVTPMGEWILGRGWNQEEWPDRRFPTAADLDPVAPSHPVLLVAKSGHALVANTRAMERAGITPATPDPPGGQIVRDESGRPTGLFLEEAMRLVQDAVPQPDGAALAQILPPALEHLSRLGLTAVHNMGDLAVLEACQRLREDGAPLPLRVVFYLPLEALEHARALRIRSGLGDGFLRVGGIKVFSDGALGPRTAAMLEPYLGEPENQGILTLEPEELQAVVRQVAESGLALAVHAIGDRANRLVLDAFAALPSEYRTRLRHRIEHVQLLHPDDLGRLASLGVVASMQPIHAVQDAPMADRYWGPARCATAYAWRSLLDAGTVLAFGSDCPVESPNPFLGIHAAVTRSRPDGYGGPEGWVPSQRITVEEAVRAYTWGGAYAAQLESRLGTLTPGKWADLIVLDQDIFAADPSRIPQTRVLGTMAGGRWVYREI
ncbi:MAG: amidohydrolase [Anaerolineae bacterium]|nr:amidohydrolase [Anaerolineae bacterium]MCX8066282.1 amidohydrolase [Anaerolineae bacterium]